MTIINICCIISTQCLKKRIMRFDESAKFFYNSLIEFIDLRKSIKEERTSTVKGEFGYLHLLKLHEICKNFIIKTNENKEIIFDLIYEEINKDNFCFDDLRKTLEKEKSFGYKNLALVTKIRLAKK